MTLRHRTAIAVLAACALITVALFFALQSVIAARFTAVEREKAAQDLARASIALDQDVAGLESSVEGWASREDTYQFMQDGNADFIAVNFGESSFSELGIDFVVFVNNSGQVAYSAAVDPSDGTRTPIFPSLEQHVTGDSILARHPDRTSSVAGILLLPEHAALVASQPVPQSSKMGAIAGSLVMGRYLSDAEAQVLSLATDLSLELRRVDEPEPPADYQAAMSSLSGGELSPVRELNGDTIAAYDLVPDIYGNPALVLRVDEPRDISAQGRQLVWYMIYLLIGFALATSFMVVVGIDSLVLRRVRRLRTSVETVADSRSSSERVAIGGRDELAYIAGAINRMLASLEQSHRALVETEARNRALVEAIPDLMFRVNQDGEVIEGSWPLRARGASGNGGGPGSRDLPDDIAERLPAQMKQLGLPHIRKALESGETQVFEFQMSPDAGSPHYEARVVPGGADVLVMVRDVTERKHEEEARQKSLLLKEIHHRVKNNLQVISGLLYLQARRTRDQKLVEVLNESSNRVKSVALIHQRLQQSKDTVSVELGEYIRDLTTVLLHSHGRESAPIRLDLDLEKNVVIGIDTAVPCGLIVNELVSNSLKHGFPDGRGGRISISLHTDESDSITLAISDNGVGLPEGLDIHKADTLGLQLAMSLSGQLGASMEASSSQDGTEFIIRFRDTPADGGKPAREVAHAGTASGDRR